MLYRKKQKGIYFASIDTKRNDKCVHKYKEQIIFCIDARLMIENCSKKETQSNTRRIIKVIIKKFI